MGHLNRRGFHQDQVVLVEMGRPTMKQKQRPLYLICSHQGDSQSRAILLHLVLLLHPAGIL